MEAALWPPGVVLAEAGPSAGDVPALPEEEAALRRPVPKRLAEFRAGRAAAHTALRRLGVDAPVLVGPAREPVWPHGVVGTIAHTAGFIAAAVAHEHSLRSIGLDVEREGALEPRLAPRICTAGDIRRLAGVADDWPTIAFVAKEAAYKALFPITRTFLDFHDVNLHPLGDGTVRALVGSGCPGVVVRLQRRDGFVLAGATAVASRG